MRATGVVETLDGLGAGDHLCWVVHRDVPYETVGSTFLADAQRLGQKPFAFGPQLRVEAAATRLNAHPADPYHHFLGRGALNAGVMFDNFRRHDAAARAEGFSGLRVLADMDWLLAEPPGSDDLLSFEVRLDEVIADIDATVVCAYRAGTFRGADVRRLAAVHPLESGREDAPLGFRIHYAGNARWRVSGEVDHWNSDAFGLALTAAATDATAVTVDLADVHFIDVTGLTTIGSVARRFPALTLTLETTSETVRRCWSLLGHDATLPSVSLVRPARARDAAGAPGNPGAPR